jgi:methionine biosynthesis protein MetW
LDYLFGDFVFSSGSFDYEKYWEVVPEIFSQRVSYSKLRLLESFISPGSSVLEIGCGDGTILAHIKKYRNAEVFGIDISEQALRLVSRRGIYTQRADITSDDFEIVKRFNYIILSEVLEHLPKPESLFLKLHGKFSRYVIVTIPNTGYIGERMRMLLGRFPKQWVVHPSEHLRFWTVSDFCFWCTQLGFRVTSYYGVPDDYYDTAIKLWKHYPRLFARYVLYIVKEKI